MITLQESHFFLIMVFTSLITYILFSIFQSCDIHCKVNFYKYENHHDTPKIKQKEPIIIKQPDINKVLFNKSSNNSNNAYIGDKTSSHSSSIQGNDIDNSEDDEIINQLFGINKI